MANRDGLGSRPNGAGTPVQARDDRFDVDTGFGVTSEGVSFAVDVLMNDFGGAAKHLVAATSASGATVSIVDGKLWYDAAFLGDITADRTDTITYTIQLGNGAMSTATATILVKADPAVAIAGRVVDGYIRDALVFADANGNGMLDTGEAQTRTDETGAFVLQGGSGPLVMSGGTDVATNLAFSGTLTAPAGYGMITPLTTLVSLLAGPNATAQQVLIAEQQVLSAFEISLAPGQSLATLDPVAAAVTGDAGGTAAFLAGASVLNTVSLISSALTGAGGQSTTQAAFAAFADALDSQSSPLELTSAATVEAMLAAASANVAVVVSADILAGTAAVAAAANAAIEAAAAETTGSALLAGVSAVSYVAQGSASDAVMNAAHNGTISAVVEAYTGIALDFQLAAASDSIGDVDGAAFNSPPVAVADQLTARTDVPLTIRPGLLLGNDADFDGDALSIIGVDQPSHGTVSIDPLTGLIVFTPEPGFAGSASFTYTVSDGGADPATATAQINVTAPLLVDFEDLTIPVPTEDNGFEYFLLVPEDYHGFSWGGLMALNEEVVTYEPGKLSPFEAASGEQVAAAGEGTLTITRTTSVTSILRAPRSCRGNGPPEP
jgi:hypothetical protein